MANQARRLLYLERVFFPHLMTAAEYITLLQRGRRQAGQPCSEDFQAWWDSLPPDEQQGWRRLVEDELRDWEQRLMTDDE